jgi:hypothetical protein
VVETRRGAEQLTRIFETLARLELTDGLRLPELLSETSGRIPRDATVVAILPSVSEQNAIALGNLKRQGFAVTAVIGVFEEFDFARAAGPLLAQGIETRQLKDEAAIVGLCRQYVLR